MDDLSNDAPHDVPRLARGERRPEVEAELEHWYTLDCSGTEQHHLYHTKRFARTNRQTGCHDGRNAWRKYVGYQKLRPIWNTLNWSKGMAILSKIILRTPKNKKLCKELMVQDPDYGEWVLRFRLHT